MTTIENFKKNKYLDIKSLIPLDICKIITKYSLLKEEVDFSPETAGEQVENAHSVYADTLMETMLHFLQPHLEKHTGLSLCPTYSYYRVYRPGMKLDRHIDRESCEVSTTVCFGYKYVGVDSDYRWGMYVAPKAEAISQDPGDLIIYRGPELEHWRDRFNAGDGSYQVQAFFHYIDKNGPFYPTFSYDGRKGIGYKDNSKQINN
jgi:hypothetical protein